MYRIGRTMADEGLSGGAMGSLAYASALMLASCAAPFVSNSRASSAQFGWLHGECIAVNGSMETLPQTILLARLDDSGDVAEAQIVAQADETNDCTALLPDRAEANRVDGKSFYVVKSAEPVEFAIGILGAGSTERMQFDHCITGEGVQFSVSDDQGVVWQDYYYLGYDGEATCPGA